MYKSLSGINYHISIICYHTHTVLTIICLTLKDFAGEYNTLSLPRSRSLHQKLAKSVSYGLTQKPALHCSVHVAHVFLQVSQVLYLHPPSAPAPSSTNRVHADSAVQYSTVTPPLPTVSSPHPSPSPSRLQLGKHCKQASPLSHPPVPRSPLQPQYYHSTALYSASIAFSR